MKKIRPLAMLVLVTISFLIIVGCSVKGAGKKGEDLYPVVRVIDGDTFVARVEGKEEKIRLIGVNTPETRHPSKGVEHYGKEAKENTQSLLENSSVKLGYDVQKRDRYGRLLAYVYLEDGTFLNALLVEEGFAQVMTVPPNVKYSEWFVALQRQAREAGKGLWGKKK